MSTQPGESSHHQLWPARPSLTHRSSNRNQVNTCQPPATRRARAPIVKAVAKPDCFQGYLKPSQISSACSCLSIPTATTVTASSFKILASGGPANGQYAAKNTVSSPPSPAFTASRENALSWTLNGGSGTLVAGDGSGGIAYLSDCGQSSGPPYCDNPNVLLGQPGTGYRPQNLYCQIFSNDDDQTCRIDCIIGGSEQNYVADGSSVWRVNYQDDVNSFTPIIGPV